MIGLHPLLAAEVAAAAMVPVDYSLSMETMRALSKKAYIKGPTSVEVGSVRDHLILGGEQAVPIRIYRPKMRSADTPAVLYFHGGGFALMDLDTHDDSCRRICAGANADVVSVAYRLAPEHPYPAGLEDCMAAWRWIRDTAELSSLHRGKVALAGDSAGGTLCMSVALRLRDSGCLEIPSAIALWYPALDLPNTTRASFKRFGDGYGLTARRMEWFWSMYLPDSTDVVDPYAAPLRAASFRRMPPTWIRTAEFDVLRDEGEALGIRLKNDGVPTDLARMAALNHGFLKHADSIADANSTIADACEWLTRASSSSADTPTTF